MSPASEAPREVSSPTTLATADGKAAPCKPVAQPSLDPVKPEIEEGLQELPVSVPAVVLEQSETAQKAPAVPEMNMASAGAPAASAGNGSISRHRVPRHHAEEPVSKRAAEEHTPAASQTKAAAAMHPQKAEPFINRPTDIKQKPLGASEKAASPDHATAMRTDSIDGSKPLQHDHGPMSHKQDAPSGERAVSTAASTAGAWLKSHSPSKKGDKATSSPGAPAVAKVQTPSKSTQHEQDTGKARASSPSITNAGAWLKSHSPGKKVDKATSSPCAPAVAKAQTPSKSTQHEQDTGKARASSPSITMSASKQAKDQPQTPAFQTSAASATAKKLKSGAQPVAAALEPSKVSIICEELGVTYTKHCVCNNLVKSF